jgi:hypothetical protein
VTGQGGARENPLTWCDFVGYHPNFMRFLPVITGNFIWLPNHKSAAKLISVLDKKQGLETTLEKEVALVMELRSGSSP